jgi:anti-anti-sigma factor
MDVVDKRYANAVVVQVPAGWTRRPAKASARSSPAMSTAPRATGCTLILDFGELEYVSSAGLRCLLVASRQMKAAKGRIMVAGMQPMVAEIFAISHFDMLFEVVPTVREALAAVSAEAAAAFRG